jgi:hypothetical protein
MADLPSVDWNETTPAGTDKRSEGDDRIRELKKQVREVIERDHEFPETGGAGAAWGMHKNIRLITQTTPTAEATHGHIYQKDTGAGVLDLYFQDYLGNEIKLTSGGKLVPKPDYTTGTVTLAASTAVVGSGTLWKTGSPNNVVAGMLFYRAGDAKAYIISSVTDDTNLVLSAAYEGTVGAGVAYVITPAWGDKINTILNLHRDSEVLKAHDVGQMIVTGWYAGDGAATLAVTTANGNAAKLAALNLDDTDGRWVIHIYARSATGTFGEYIKFGNRTGSDGLNSLHIGSGGQHYGTDMIISGDADGFTVGTSNKINETGTTYNFIIIKEANGTP